MARLVIRNQVLEDHVHELQGPVTLLGRDRECQLRLTAPQVSRFHARIEPRPDGHVIEDLGSRNGTFVNDRRLTGACALEDGDRVRLGNLVLHYDAPEGAPASPAQSGRRALPAALAALLLLAGAFGIFLSLQENEDRTGDGQGSQAAAAPGSAGAGAGPRETPTPEAPESPRTQGATRPAAASRPSPHTRPASRPRAAGPPPDRLVRRDGGVLLGRVLQETPDALVFVLQADGTRVSVPKAEVRTWNGRPMKRDPKAVAAERLDAAESPAELLEVARWCREKGLEEEALAAARRILETHPDHAGARRLLGQYRYRGSWHPEKELEALGALDPGGGLQGTVQDRREIRRLWLSIIGRPPTEAERREALEQDREALRKSLLDSPELVARWYLREALLLAGPLEAVPMAPLIERGADSVARKETGFREAWSDLCLDPALERKLPSVRDRVGRVLRAALDVDPGRDPRLWEDAASMWQGRRVAVFGDRGRSPRDLLKILAAQPAFYRTRLVLLSRMLRGRPPTSREVTRWSLRLAADPDRFHVLLARWGGQEDTKEPGSRSMDALQLVRALYVDALDRPPSLVELLRGVAAQQALGDPVVGQGVLAACVGRLARDAAWVPPAERAAVAQEAFRKTYGRDPGQEELERATELLDAAEGGRGALYRALLADPGYRSY